MAVAPKWPEHERNRLMNVESSIIDHIGELREYDPQGQLDRDHVSLVDRQRLNRWVTCFQSPDDTIYLHAGSQSTDGGQTIVKRDKMPFNEMLAVPEGAVLSTSGMFLALDALVNFEAPGCYSLRTWRGEEPVGAVEGQATLHIENGPGPREQFPDEWYGLYVHRSIVQRNDGALLATLEGNLADDTEQPNDECSKTESRYRGRSVVVISRDQGVSWEFLSTIAVSQAGDPVGEGFGEPTMIQLNDGRLLCLMRTGHYTPMYASWSDDGGASWSEPAYTGLDRGCDPCLLQLQDGRVAVSYGKRFPEGWSRLRSDHERWKYPGQGLIRLAISEDGTGESWQVATIGREMGSCYSTIIEVEPGVLFCQVDGWFWHVQLA